MKEKLEAIIEHGGDEKYIIVHVKEDKYLKKVLVSLPYKYHSDIAYEYESRLNGKAKGMKIEGGGIIQIDKTAKKVKTYGTSGGYGDPDISEVKAILKKVFLDYKIDAKVTAYIRG